MDQKLYAKKELISWLNCFLTLNIKNIQELANGAVFCQLIDAINPGGMRMKKINWNAKLQHENLANLKLLSTEMMQAGLDKSFNPSRIALGKSQDILQLLQWFRKYYFSHNIPTITYKAVQRRLSNPKNNQLEKVRLSNHRIKLPHELSLKKPQKSQKKEREFQETEDLKNYIRITKDIEKIAYDQKTSSDLKVQIIKSIIFTRKGTGEVEKSEQKSKNKQIDNASSVYNSSNKTVQLVKLEEQPHFNINSVQQPSQFIPASEINQKINLEKSLKSFTEKQNKSPGLKSQSDSTKKNDL